MAKKSKKTASKPKPQLTFVQKVQKAVKKAYNKVVKYFK